MSGRTGHSLTFPVVGFLAGLMLVQQWPVLPGWQWLAVPLGLMAGCYYRRYSFGMWIAAGVTVAMIAGSWRLAAQLAPELEGKEIAIEGIVADLPEQDEKRLRFDFLVTQAAEPVPELIRLSWYNPAQVLKAGERWALTVKLKLPHGTFNPAGFDYERWLFLSGIGATGYVRPAPAPVLLGRQVGGLHPLIWRQAIAEQLDSLLFGLPTLPLIKALTIGDGSGISQTQWQLFRKTGTIHLIVISGSHIALVAGLVYLLVLKTWSRTGILRYAPPTVAALSALLAGLGYAGLAGFSVPTQRAVIMLAMAMLAVVWQRNSRPLPVLILAVAGVLSIDPLAVLSAGFWLSFGAVAVIIYISSGRLGKSGLWHELWHINWVTSAALAPLLLLFFQQFSLVSPPANLLAVPVISFLIVPLALIAVLVMLIIPAVAAKLFFAVNLLLEGLQWYLAQLAKLPIAVIHQPAPSIIALLLGLAGIIMALAPKGWPGRRLGWLCCLPAIFPPVTPLPNGAVKMTLLDVGQGLSAVVQTAEHQLVFDTGGKFSADSDMGQSVVLPFLYAKGTAKIDQLLISHGDNDHTGGAASVLAEFPAQTLLTSVPQQFTPYAPVACRAGQSWLWDEVKFTVLSPDQPFASDNDNSCVLHIQSKYGSILLPADIEAAAEQELVNRYGPVLKAEVLVAPHHGSKTSSTIEFLQAVHPNYVLIPSGYRNQFGHPHPDVVKRYRQANLISLSSAADGAITVEMNPADGIQVRGLRASAGKYWNNNHPELTLNPE